MSRLLVLGNAGLDTGLALPRLPRPGETLVGEGRGSAPGGKGLNQAVVAVRTGLLPVAFLAPLGRDAEAARVAGALAAEGFAALDLPRPGPPTDGSVLMVLPDGENAIASWGACALALPAADAAAAVTALPEGAWVLLQGNLSPAATLAACHAARERGLAVMLNAAPLAWDLAPVLPLCAAVVANRDEAAVLTGGEGPDAAGALVVAGAGLAVVTLGAQGCVVADADGMRALPAPAVAAVDSTGAGDTLCGVLAACLAAWPGARHPGAAQDAALGAAQAAAALSVQRPGCFAALPDRGELAALLPKRKEERIFFF